MRRLIHGFKKRYIVPERQKIRLAKKVTRHPAFVIPIMTFGLLIFVSAIAIVIAGGGKPRLKTSDTHVVIISHDKVEQSLPTRAQTVKEALDKANVKLAEGDVVEPSMDTEIVSDNFRINVYRAVPVTIVDGTKKMFAYSAAKTPRSIVKQAGIEVYPEDRLSLLPVKNFLIEGSIGERVVVERATNIHLNIYGTQVAMRTLATTVEDLLKERKVKLEPTDTVQPASNTPITPDLQIFLIRKGTQIATEEVEIEAPKQIVEDGSLSFGSTAVRQQGSPGKKLVTYQIQLENNVEVSRKVIQEVITTEPITHIVARGKAVQIPDDKQAVMAAAGIASSDYPYVDFIMSHESGWCPTKLQGQIGYCPPYAPETIPSGKGYGIGQATPGTKMAPYGADWKTNVITQLKWAIAYTNGRYGSWSAAYNYWQSHRNW